MDGVRAVASVVTGLINANCQTAGNGSDEVTLSAQQEGLCGGSVAETADQRAPARAVERQNAKEILEAARDAIGTVIFLGIGITQVSRSMDENMLARLYIDSSIGPLLVVRDLDIMRQSGT